LSSALGTTVLPAGGERSASADLPRTARKILDAARKLLVERGYAGIRFDAIAAESGVNKSMIRYYFGSKDGLVAAIVDDLTHDSTIEVLSLAQTACGTEDRTAAHLAATRRLLDDPSFKNLFDVLPVAMRRTALRQALADLYEWYREVNCLCFGEGENDQEGELRGLACVFMAAIDGLAMQVALDEERVDLDASWQVLGQMVRSYLQARPGARPDVSNCSLS
jgi:TetR/AcrR family acrAB operon transcriptional repressor